MLLIVFGLCPDLVPWICGKFRGSRIALFAREGLTFALSGHQKLLRIASFLLLCTQERAKSDFGAFLGRSGSAWACKIDAFPEENNDFQGIGFCARRHPKRNPSRGAQMVPRSFPKHPLWASMAPQEPPKAIPRAPFDPLGALQMLQNRLNWTKLHPRALQQPPKSNSGSISHLFW